MLSRLSNILSLVASEAPLESEKGIAFDSNSSSPAHVRQNIRNSVEDMTESVAKRLADLGDGEEELDPILKLGVNAEVILENLRDLSSLLSRLLNQSGYSGAYYFVYSKFIFNFSLGPLEGTLNRHLDKLEFLAKEQLKL